MIFIPSMVDFYFFVFLFIKMHSDVKMYPDNIWAQIYLPKKGKKSQESDIFLHYKV